MFGQPLPSPHQNTELFQQMARRRHTKRKRILISVMRGAADRSSYRVVIPLTGLTKKRLAEAVIPTGSRVEWQQGDYAGGLAHVHWHGREFLVIEGELFKQCGRI